MYRISVKAIQGTILTYTVKDYDIDKGFVKFRDKKTSKVKRFAVSNCEIEEV